MAIVTYAGAAGVALPSTRGTDKQKILDALESLQARGTRERGYQLAYEIAERNFVKEEQPGDPLYRWRF